jgi:ATP sulfurylase
MKTIITGKTNLFLMKLVLSSISVVEHMRLANGLLWPIPITLDVSKEELNKNGIQPSKRIALLDSRDYEPLAILTVEDIYCPNKPKEAKLVYGADDIAHPAVNYLHNIAKEFNIGGSLEAIQPPSHYDYVSNRCKSLYVCFVIQLTKRIRYTHRASCSLQETSLDSGCRLPNA